MQYCFTQTCLFVFLLLLSPAIPFAQSPDDLIDTGPVGTTNDQTDAPGDDVTPGWEDLQDPQWGLAGLAVEREPHEACDLCFTVPRDVDPYQVYEYVEGDGPEAVILSRRVPNPAPLREGEVRATVDEGGEPIWYIGRQGIIGPTDDERLSDTIAHSYIEVRRIQERHQHTILSLEGVHGIGIEAHGFVVNLLPSHADLRDTIPTTLEGVPVHVEISDVGVPFHHHGTRLRPIPDGVGARTSYIPGSGTLGPHVVRDVPYVSECCHFWTLTAAHLVKDNMFLSGGTNSYVYQPWTNPLQVSNRIGTVDYAFTLTGCGPTIEYCEVYGPINYTNRRPDAAAVVTAGLRQPLFNEAEEDEDPIRRMQYRSSSYINGPSGMISEPRLGRKVTVWGAVGGGNVGKITAINRCEVLDYSDGYARICGITVVEAEDVIQGDSGSLVTYRGRGNRHVVGLLFGGDLASDDRYIIPALNLKRAFGQVSQSFSHYWGTKEGYRRPATTETD